MRSTRQRRLVDGMVFATVLFLATLLTGMAHADDPAVLHAYVQSATGGMLPRGELRVGPGNSSSLQAVVVNQGPGSVDVRLLAVERRTGVDGFAVYEPESSWLSIHPDEVAIPAGGARTVTVEVSLPATAEPGTYDGAVWAVPRTGGADGAFVVPLAVTVPGVSPPAPRLHGARAIRGPHGIAVGVDLSNVGGSALDLRGSVNVPALGVVHDFVVDPLMPRDAVTLRIPLDTAPPADTLAATVDLESAHGRLHWRGSLDFARPVAAGDARYVPAAGASVLDRAWTPALWGGVVTLGVRWVRRARRRGTHVAPKRLALRAHGFSDVAAGAE